MLHKPSHRRSKPASHGSSSPTTSSHTAKINYHGPKESIATTSNSQEEDETYPPKHNIYPSLINRRILVTGGATGIGASIVSEFHKQGSKVAFLDIDEENGKRLSATLGLGRAEFISCDVSDVSELRSGLEKAEEWLEGFDVLVNNAANDRRHKTLEVTEAEYDELMNVNLKHQFFAAQHVIRRMVKDELPQGGVVLNISSGCWLMGRYPSYPVYMMAKAGVSGLSQSLGREFGPAGLRVNSIMPGWVMTDRQLRQHVTPESNRHLMNDQCLKLALLPEDIAKMALFLASDDARMITKQMFVVDAGAM